MRRSLLIERLGELPARAIFARKNDPDYWLCKGQFSNPDAYSGTLSGVAGLICKGFAYGAEKLFTTQVITRYNLQDRTGRRLKVTVKYSWNVLEWGSEAACIWLTSKIITEECSVREPASISPCRVLGPNRCAVSRGRRGGGGIEWRVGWYRRKR